MNRAKFTQEEMELLAQNPYTADVSPCYLFYTLEFKKYALKEAAKGVSSVQIFKRAGYDVELLGKPRIYSALKYFKAEIASPRGLRESNHSRQSRLDSFIQKDLKKKKTDKAVREIQNRMDKLEQEVEFLKKIQFLRQSATQKSSSSGSKQPSDGS